MATDSAIRVQVTAVGEETALAGIQRLVAEAQASSSRAQALADRAAALLFYFAPAPASITFVVWSLLGEPDQAVDRTVTVLVIACPHALGLAIPLVIAISTERAARAGVLVKDRLALERMRTVDAVLFDKTGTLTKGSRRHRHRRRRRRSPSGAARAGGGVEADSEHPLARAIVRAAAAAHRRRRSPPATTSGRCPAAASQAEVDGTDGGGRGAGPAARAGRRRARRRCHGRSAAGRSAGPRCCTWSRRQVIGALALEDEVRPESRQAVDALQPARGARSR